MTQHILSNEDYPSIRIHRKTYEMLRKMGQEQRRTTLVVMDMLVEAEYLKDHPQPISDQEAEERR